MHIMESAGRTRASLDKASADAQGGLSRAATIKERAREGGPRMRSSRSAPDLRHLSRFERESQPPSILENLQLHPVHEEPGKAGGQLDLTQSGDGAQSLSPATRGKVWKNLTKVARIFRKSGHEPEGEGARVDDPSTGPKFNANGGERSNAAVRRLSRFSDGGVLDNSLPGSRQSGATSQKGGSLREEDNDVLEPSRSRSSRRRLARAGAIVQKSAHAMRRYTTHSVSRRSLTQGNTAGQEDHPDSQNTASRLSTLSENWQREFYGKPLSELTRMSRSEDQSSLRSGKTETSSGAGDSQSHYGMSTEKAPHGVWLPLIHPYSRARRDVNVLIAACLLYIAIVLPYEFCFNVHVEGYWLIADGVVTVIFLLDVLVNFRTGFVLKGKREVKDGLRILKPAKIVMEPRAIARRYLKGWFTIDFLSSFPWDFLLFAPSVNERYWVLQVLRSLKILRIHRLTIVRSELRETWSAGQREFIDICCLFFLTLYFSHICACLFVAVGKLQRDPQRWLEQTHYDDHGDAGVLSDGPQIDVYIASMYFQMVSLATVGYGDIHAGITIPDRAFMTVADLFGALFMAYIVGKISSLIILKRDRRYALRERFATLHAYVAREELPEWLATRLMVHLSRQWGSQIIEFSEVELIKDMTDELRSEMLIHWWRKAIPSSALLPHKHGFLGLLLAKCKLQVHPEREVLTREGETVRQLWILRAGQLAVSRSVALDDLDIATGGVSDEEPTSDEDTTPDLKDPGARQLSRLTSYKRPDQRGLHRLPTFNWAVDLDRGDQSDKALVTEMAAPGTVIGEAPLLLALAQKVVKDRSAKQAGVTGKRKLAVKAIVQDVTVECKTECSVLVLLLDDLFEILDQYPSLTHKLKKTIVRAERHMKRNDAAASLSHETDG